jgi:hypothetical protein
LLHEFLDWVADRPRSYDDAIEAWRSNCPRHPVLDDAFTDGLIAVVGKSVVVTESGRQCQDARGRRRPMADPGTGVGGQLA